MSRWISLLVLCSAVLVCGVDVAWAAPASVEAHGCTPPAESGPSAEEAEEEKEGERSAGPAATAPGSPRGSWRVTEAGPLGADAPPVPPPR